MADEAGGAVEGTCEGGEGCDISKSEMEKGINGDGEGVVGTRSEVEMQEEGSGE